MGKAIVVYESRYGSTKRYAEWVAENCRADLIVLEKADIDAVARYETVIFGSCVYAGAIRGISFLKNNREELAGARLFVFTVGLTQPGDQAAQDQMLSRNFTREERAGIRFFSFPGALDYRNYHMKERFFLYLLRKRIGEKKEAERSEMERYLFDFHSGKLDFCNRRYIAELTDAVMGTEARQP
jgi:menaquinone-dependent protoporphyrinogen IX oxidase